MGRKNNRSWWGSFSDDSWYSRKPRYGFWSFSERRKEMISPYMLSYDAIRLHENVRNQLVKINTCLQRNVIPNHLMDDIYSLYYHKSTDQEICIIDKTNQAKFKLLSMVNDSSVKIITNGSAIASTIFTVEICKGLLEAFTQGLDQASVHQATEAYYNQCEAEKKEEEDEDRSDDSGNGGDKEDQDRGNSSGNSEQEGAGGAGEESANNNQQSGGSEGGQGESDNDSNKDREQARGGGEAQNETKTNGRNSSSQSSSSNSGTSSNGLNCEQQQMEDLLDMAAESIERSFARAKQAAYKKISELEKYGLDAEALRAHTGEEIGEIVNNIDKIIDTLKNVKFSEKALKPIISKIVDKSTAYFSKRSKTKHISILESDDIADIDGLEFLHPVLKNIKLDEVTTRERKSFGRLNVYVDISTSMKDSLNFGSVRLQKLTFAKALCMKLVDMKIVDSIIKFNDRLLPPINNPSISTVALIGCAGGTSIDRVIEDCENRRENALVITDCEDSLHCYSPNCFILGTPGATIYLNDEGEQFQGSGQIWIFNSSGNDIIQMY